MHKTAMQVRIILGMCTQESHQPISEIATNLECAVVIRPSFRYPCRSWLTLNSSTSSQQAASLVSHARSKSGSLKLTVESIVPTYPRTDGNFSIINGDIGNFKNRRDVVKWVSGVQVDALKKFESGTADSFIEQILAEATASK